MGKSKDLATGASYVDTSGDTMTGALGIGGVSKTTALSSAAHFDTLGLIVDDNTAYDNVGVGGGIAFRGKRNTSGTQTVFGAIDVGKESASNDSYTGSLRFYTNNNSTGIPTKHMNIDALGRVTKPNQPAFNVKGGNSWITTSAGNSTTFAHNTVAFNVGNHFNTSNHRFVAPVAGRYFFATNAYVRLETNDDDTNHAYLYIHKNGAAYNNAYAIFGYVNNGDADQTQSISVVMDMAVNDYATVSFNSASGASSYYGNGTTFSGFLIG